MAETPVLSLSLTNWGTVVLESDGAHAEDVRYLLLGFPTAELTGRSAFEVDTGSFLATLSSLNRWPGAVEWSPTLRQLAERTLDDADHMRGLPTSETSGGAAVELGENWRGELTDFQERDLERLIGMKHGANFSVPGAGKTRVALAFYEHLRRSGTIDRAIVIAPKSAHESWINESTTAFVAPPTVAAATSNSVPRADIALINYERLPGIERGLAAALGRGKVLFILDEAHRMKRGSVGAWGRICLGLGPLATIRLVLSGTPAPNGMSDLRSLFEFAWPGHGGRLVPASATPATLAGTLSPYFARTTKEELGLPDVSVMTRTVELPPLHRETYDALLGQLRRDVADSEKIDDLGRTTVYLLMAATSPALLAVGASRYDALEFSVPPLEVRTSGRLRSLLAELPSLEMSPKLLEAVRIARDNASIGRKTIIWSTFIKNVNTLASMLTDLNPNIVVGSVPDAERHEAIQRFRSDDDSWVLISNPATLGEGISLHHDCHDAVYLDRDFAAGRFLQSIDRIHRLGLPLDQETRVTVITAADTIDELVNQRLDLKVRWMSEVLDDPSLRQLADLEEEREVSPVLDASDAEAVWRYLSSGALP